MILNKLMVWTLYSTIFISTGAVIDFMVLGNSREIQIQNNSNLRLLIWLPLYVLFTLYSIKYYKKILDFLFQYRSFFALLLLTLVSFIWSDVRFLTIYSSLQLILITCFAIAVASNYPLKSLTKILYQTFSMIITLSIVAVIFMPDYGTSVYVGETSYRGVFIEKNRLGQILVYYFLLAFIHFKFDYKNLFVLCSALFLLSGNGSMTALVLILLLPFLIRSTRLFNGRKDLVASNSILLFFLTIIASMILFFSFEGILAFLGKDPTLTGRTELWTNGFISIMERPLTGFGYNAFWPSSAEWGGEYIQLLLKWGPRSMHNGWFELVLQLGVLGSLLSLIVFFQYFKLSLLGLERDNFSRVMRATLVLLVLIFIWSQMQHILFRHQALTHFMFTLTFCALSQQVRSPYKTRVFS